MKWQRFLIAEGETSYRVIAIARHAHTGSGCGVKFAASFAMFEEYSHQV